MSNGINDNNNFTLMFGEIIKLSTTLQQLSANVDNKISRLPDNKDFDNSIKKLEKIIDEIDNINSFITKSENSDITIVKNITDIRTTLNDIKVELSDKRQELMALSVSSKDIKTLLEDAMITFNNIHNVVCNDNSDLVSKINNINTLTNDIKEQVHNSYVRLNNRHIQLHDLDEVIEYAKRANQRYKFWKGWKAIVAVIAGSIIGVSALMNNLKWLIEMIFGG